MKRLIAFLDRITVDWRLRAVGGIVMICAIAGLALLCSCCTVYVRSRPARPDPAWTSAQWTYLDSVRARIDSLEAVGRAEAWEASLFRQMLWNHAWALHLYEARP